MSYADDSKDLSLESVIGFNGLVPNGLQYTPCGKYICYPLGSIIAVRSIISSGENHAFLDAENDQKVSCIALSKDGKYLVSGYTTEGSTTKDAHAVIWDLPKAIENCDRGTPSAGGCVLHYLYQHKGKIQAVDFNSDNTHVLTLGGRDDNDLVLWDVETGKKICGSPAATDAANCVRWLHGRNDRFVTCGSLHLRVWQVCFSNPKMHAINATMGSMRRIMHCLGISNDDAFAYAGSTTGEVLMFRIDRDDIKPFNEPDSKRPFLQTYNQERFSKGVRSLACIINPATGNTNILAGAGDGVIQILNPKMELIHSHRAQLSGAVTSISLSPGKNAFCVGTELSQRYVVDVPTFTPELCGTCHFGEIYDVKFPKGCSDLFITASVEDIRVWNAYKKQELLRIRAPNHTCYSIDINKSGSTIVSGWSDGKIRAFLPESGKLSFLIPDAHSDGVTSLSICDSSDRQDCEWRIVSGGKDGRVRVWKVTPSHQKMLFSMKEHRGTIYAVKCDSAGKQAVSASADGSCIVWDIVKGIRTLAMYDPTIFTDVLLHPDESQYLTCGENCKISYWDAYDGSAIRVIGGGDGKIRCLDIQQEGDLFVSGSADKLVKLWTYDDGIVIGVGKGHSGKINKVAISPDQQKLISIDSEGGIFIWKISEFMTQKK